MKLFFFFSILLFLSILSILYTTKFFPYILSPYEYSSFLFSPSSTFLSLSFFSYLSSPAFHIPSRFHVSRFSRLILFHVSSSFLSTTFHVSFLFLSPAFRAIFFSCLLLSCFPPFLSSYPLSR